MLLSWVCRGRYVYVGVFRRVVGGLGGGSPKYLGVTHIYIGENIHMRIYFV